MAWPALLFGVLRHPAFLLLSVIGLGWALVSINSQGFQGPPAKPEARIVASVALAVVDRDDGSIDVIHAEDASELRSYAEGEGSFFRGVMRTLARERASRNITSDAEFVLELTDKGGLLLVDHETGYWIAIEAFGPTNYADFRVIFDRARALGLATSDGAR